MIAQARPARGRTGRNPADEFAVMIGCEGRDLLARTFRTWESAEDYVRRFGPEQLARVAAVHGYVWLTAESLSVVTLRGGVPIGCVVVRDLTVLHL